MKTNKIRIMWTVVVAMLMVGLTGCDGHHDPLDISMKVEHIHVSHNEKISGTGYAVYLNDLAPEAFADSLGVSQGTSADMEAYDGNENTFALYDTDDVSSPMAIQVFDMWQYGQSAYIPSVVQMRLLYTAKKSVNRYIKACGGTPLSDEADECWYWTSTEVKGQETAKAWLFSMGSGAMQEKPKLQGHKVRPVVTLYNDE